LNAFVNPEGSHRAYLVLGSNIDPEKNMRQALRLLRKKADVLAISTCWETEAVTSSSTPEVRYPNFLNMAVCFVTGLGPAEIKQQIITPIENALGRVRTADKYAPRTIDLDLIVYEDQVIDPDLWKRPFLALTLAELLPDLANTQTGEKLPEAASRLKMGYMAIPHRSGGFTEKE
jgi:2-amino-4-hydroxy-6-hydroxymethyldihydropteridine diphosphokinase